MLARSFITGLLLLAVSSALASLDDQRRDFLAAENALRTADLYTYRKLAEGLENYPLFPYLVRRQLQANLNLSQEAHIARFLERYSGEPLSRPLQRAWLRKLVDSGSWKRYIHYYAPGLGSEFECRYLQALYTTGRRTEALASVPDLWLSEHSRPKACDPLFALWRQQGGLTSALVWERFQMALGSNEVRLARYLIGLLPEADRPTAELWIRVHKNPASNLSGGGKIDPRQKTSAALVLHGLHRWARYDPAAVSAALPDLRTRYHLPADQSDIIQRQVALRMASRYAPDASQLLSDLSPEAEDEAVKEWRVRLALRAGDWPRTLEAIKRLGPEQGSQLRWQYWLARAMEAANDKAGAQAIYRSLAKRRDYHGFLAAERMDLPYRFEQRSLEVDPSVLESTARLPELLRARELVHFQRYPDARREWRHGTASVDREALLAAASLASAWGWDSQAIATVAQAKDWDDLELRFPINHRQRVVSAAQRNDLDPGWVLGIVRQESMFQTDARSSAGALGLMQVMPKTARAVAQRLKLSLRGDYDLLKPEKNIEIGTHYLRMSLNRLQDRVVLATAGYNAGPRRVRQWLPTQESISADVWVETVPFAETRKYLKKVLEYGAIYQYRLGYEPQLLREQMRPLQGVSGQPLS